MVKIIIGLVSVLLAMIAAVESPGSGEEKKQTVIDGFLKVLPEMKLPAWLQSIFAIPAVIGAIVDIAVLMLKKTGVFTAENPT